jgi:hypothetical protein
MCNPRIENITRSIQRRCYEFFAPAAADHNTNCTKYITSFQIRFGPLRAWRSTPWPWIDQLCEMRGGGYAMSLPNQARRLILNGN